jgi:lipopolysaccharide transport system ATP-binding protein
MSEVVIRLDGLSKMYALGVGQPSYRTLRDTVTETFRASVRGLGGFVRGRRERAQPDNTVWALNDLCLEIRRGEAVGIIGRNGAGKSTLLKILSRITEPTSGTAEIRGRIGSLLEVGTGFHPELTGRENIYLNGSILGMKRVEIDRRFDEIVAFSEIERFIDTPVKHYSSGMYLRLAFSVAAHLDPEILLIDEVLAVGDAAFQKKCLGKMNDVTGQGRTILFVSHNMAAIAALCSRAVFLDRGQLVLASETAKVVDAYMRSVEEVASTRLEDRVERRGTQALRFLDLEFQNADGEKIVVAYSSQTIVLAIRYRAQEATALNRVIFFVQVRGKHGEPLFQLETTAAGQPMDIPSRGIMLCKIPRLPLRPGRYSFGVLARVSGMVADEVEHAAILDVEPGDFFGTGRVPYGAGPLLVDHSWEARQD